MSELELCTTTQLLAELKSRYMNMIWAAQQQVDRDTNAYAFEYVGDVLCNIGLCEVVKSQLTEEISGQEKEPLE